VEDSVAAAEATLTEQSVSGVEGEGGDLVALIPPLLSPSNNHLSNGYTIANNPRQGRVIGDATFSEGDGEDYLSTLPPYIAVANAGEISLTSKHSLPSNNILKQSNGGRHCVTGFIFGSSDNLKLYQLGTFFFSESFCWLSSIHSQDLLFPKIYFMYAPFISLNRNTIYFDQKLFEVC